MDYMANYFSQHLIPNILFISLIVGLVGNALIQSVRQRRNRK